MSKAGLVYWCQQGTVFIDYDRQGIVTALPDGTEVVATPNYTPEDIARAHSLGYRGDVAKMTMDHDPLHTKVAEMLGFKESYSLRAAATGEDSEIAGLEEEVVLAAQRLLNKHRELEERKNGRDD